ncbi:Protein of unknown function DUF2637 [Actinobacteria bacterium OK074]|nr:Protein of unknown function DUF2637 [Actinobacteria bacterium OK074]
MTPAPTPTALGVLDRAAILVLGGAGCALSYDALQQMAVAIHVRGMLTYLFPAVIDGFIAYGVRALILTHTAPWATRLYVWTLFATATAASIWANALHAIRLNQLDGRNTTTGLRLGDTTVGILSTVAPLALAGAVHLYILIARHPTPGTVSPHWSAERGPHRGPDRVRRTGLPDPATADRALARARTGRYDGPDDDNGRGPHPGPVPSPAVPVADRPVTANGAHPGPRTDRPSGPRTRTVPWPDSTPLPRTNLVPTPEGGLPRAGSPSAHGEEADEAAQGPHTGLMKRHVADRGPEYAGPGTGLRVDADREERDLRVRSATADGAAGPGGSGEGNQRAAADHEESRTGPREPEDRPHGERDQDSLPHQAADPVPVPGGDADFEALLKAVRDIVRGEPVLKRTLLRAALDRHNTAVQDPADRVQVSNERLGPILQCLKEERERRQTSSATV